MQIIEIEIKLKSLGGNILKLKLLHKYQQNARILKTNINYKRRKVLSFNAINLRQGI